MIGPCWGGGGYSAIEVRYIWTPPSYGTFSTPLRCVSALFFQYKNLRQSGPEALLEGPEIIGRARSVVRFPPPYVLHPPYHGPNRVWRNRVVSLAAWERESICEKGESCQEVVQKFLCRVRKKGSFGKGVFSEKSIF